MKNSYIISKSAENGGIIIITTKREGEGRKQVLLLQKIEEMIRCYGDFRIICFYETPGDKTCFDFKTDIPFELFDKTKNS